MYVPPPLSVCAWIAPTEGAGAPADPEEEEEKRLCRAGADPETLRQRRIKEGGGVNTHAGVKRRKASGKVSVTFST